MESWQQRLLNRFPQTRFVPQPDFRLPTFVKNYTQVPSDYLQWMKGIGSFRRDDQLEVFPSLHLAEHFIKDAKHCGVDNVLIFGKFEHGYVGFTTAFETWYVVVIVGEMNLCTAPKPKLSFSDYLEMFAMTGDDRSDHERALWYVVSEWNMRYVVIASGVMLVVVIWAIYLINLLGSE